MPERLRAGLHFEEIFEAFGGKVAHWHDYITDYGELEYVRCFCRAILTKKMFAYSVNSNGRMDGMLL